MRITKLISGITLFALLAVIFAISNSSNASALSGSEFQSGRIIDDVVFFNPNAMNAGDIQAFLNSKVPSCDTNGTQPHSSGQSRAAYGTSQGNPPPYTCLKNYVENVATGRTPDAYCGGTVFAGTKTAAQIINDVSQACGVSPKALIVLLQKEQSLVTDDWPWNIQYRSATGFGCPDTAPCDAEYYGFFNQVYNAARQFQRYAKQPSSFNYRGGATSFVQYNPVSACGGGNVAMQNQATAGLYNYTPYQPNAAALANLYGTGDGCSAYGNRNFWRMYIDWFGSPHTNTPFAWAYEGQWAYADAGRTQSFTSIPTATPGGKVYVRVKARNMGNQTWDQSFLHIAASRPMDTASPLADAGWVSNSRAAKMLEASVAPGQIATFEFALQAPAQAGTYSQYFNLVAEGHTWLNDLGLFFTINANTGSTENVSVNNVLSSGESISRDEPMMSADEQSVFTLQRDGNLVLYSNFVTAWNLGYGTSATRVVMQADGNLVMYNDSNQAVWSSGTNGNPGARLVLQTDGNMVIYSSTNVALWATYTIHTPNHLSYVNTTMYPGRVYPGQRLSTANKNYNLILQPDGNLVLYSPTRPIWATGTDGRQIAFLALQGDGNMVLYDTQQRPIWYSGTAGHGPLRALVQPDGNFVLYNSLNSPRWNTGTSGAQ